jgi:hypothetical protein
MLQSYHFRPYLSKSRVIKLLWWFSSKGLDMKHIGRLVLFELKHPSLRKIATEPKSLQTLLFLLVSCFTSESCQVFLLVC